MQLNYKYVSIGRAMSTAILHPLSSASAIGLGLVLLLGGCTPGGDGDDHGHDHDHESEVITTVTLTFSPSGGADVVSATFSDPDGAGGMSGQAEPITLQVGTTYALAVAFTNALLDPVEDITAEIEEEAEEHQIFITGTGVAGPAAGDDPNALVMHAYADVESGYGPNVGDDLPVGLANTVTTVTAGAGTLGVRLQHMPELNDMPQKVAGLAEQLAMGTLLPGDADVAVEFELTVQ